MNHLQRLLIVILLLILSSCAPKISTNLNKNYKPLDYRQDVLVFGINSEIPDNTEVLGSVRIGDTGFSTKCSYEIVVDKAKIEARKAGGNGIKITKHNTPNALGSSCHRITAKILKIDNVENLKLKQEDVLLDIDYAILNVYRYSGVGSLIGYDLHLGDSVLCRVRNNFKTTIHIKKEGRNTLWSKTESKSEIPINFKKGKTYYLRCSMKIGAFVGRPKLELVDNKTGKAEFESFNAKHK